MKSVIPTLSNNPFEKDVVHEPRDHPPSVSSLNHETLDELLSRFKKVESSGESPSRKAELILSPAPGYGKSHLIGRFFKELGNQAVRVYIPPFETTSTYWQSILLLTVDELDQAADWNSRGFEEPTQLDAFAEGVLRSLTAGAIRRGAIQVVRGDLSAEAFENSPEVSLRDGQDRQSVWFRGHFLDDLLPILRQQMAPLRLKSAEWPRILFAYLTAPPGSDERQNCLTWMRYEALDDNVSALWQLPRAENPVPEPVENVNVGAWTRLSDLCTLSRFYQPIVFCFDQTEGYTVRPELMSQFGNTVSRIVAECNCQLTVVTANQNIWDARLLPGMDVAHRDRFSEPHLLKPLSRTEAEELIDLRLKASSPSEKAVRNLKDPKWLDSVFVGARGIPAREFMKLCRLRWDGKSATGVQRRPLAEIYQEYLAEFLANPHWLKFDPDTFRWLVQGPFVMGSNIACKPISLKSGYFELMWQQGDSAEVMFGFLHEGQHNQWKKIAQLTEEWASGQSGKQTKAVFFRTAELSKVPKANWKATGEIIEKAMQRNLELITLTSEETARLYSARDLYNEALAGNADGYSGSEVLEFLVDEIGNWRERLLRPRAR
jgi:DNA segregation ATPase FtsK/SpoIIIE, S-DNA-T family